LSEEENLKVTFVELGSKGCVPCDMMQPIMEVIKSEYPSQVMVVFHDVRTKDGYAYAQKYKIRVIPTQVFLIAKGMNTSAMKDFILKKSC
jgi:Thioredoxin.